MASREGRQRQQTAVAALLGVILAWFVLGQMAEPNGLLARLSRFLFVLRPQLAGKQRVAAQRHSSAIRRLLDERESFLLLASGIPAQGVDVCVWQCVCVCLCCSHVAKLLEAVGMQFRAGEGLQREYFCPSSPVVQPVHADLGEPSGGDFFSGPWVASLCPWPGWGNEERKLPVQITLWLQGEE